MQPADPPQQPGPPEGAEPHERPDPTGIPGPLRPVAARLDAVRGFESLPCDGLGHPIEGALACLHARCSLPSPDREQALGGLATLARKAGFVMAALVDRRGLYCLSYKPGKRGGDLDAAAAKLEALLADPPDTAALELPDRRGR